MYNEIANNLFNGKIKFIEDVDLSEFTNTKTGGKVPLMIYPRNIKEIKYIVTILRKNSVNSVVLGDMTNVAIASGNLDFVIINMVEYYSAPVLTDNILEVSAGYKMKDLSRWALEHSLSGLQWMEGIPGTVGAGTYMNAGFLPGQNFQSCIVSATVLMPDLTVQVISNKEMKFSFRKSIVQKNGGIVLKVKLLLRKGKKWRIAIQMARYHYRRAKHQPLNFPSAGTVFIPPTPFHVGGMLPNLGLVGYKIGGAQVSKKSPGFIVGVDHMTGEDYYSLVKYIQEQIKNNYDIELEPEVRLLGFKTFNETK